MRPLSDYRSWKFHFNFLKASNFTSEKTYGNPRVQGLICHTEYADLTNMSYKGRNLLQQQKLIRSTVCEHKNKNLKKQIERNEHITW